LYAELGKAGIEVMYDDRDERPGVKFKDADLVGLPYRIAVGKKGVAEGIVELKSRRSPEVVKVKIEDIARVVSEKIVAERGGTSS
jgi:prolyl-tRNA synthetase